MAENTYKSNTFKKPEKEKKSKSKSKSKFSLAFLKDPRFQLASGFLLLMISIFLFAAFVSYLFTGKADQSVVESLGTAELKETENWLGMAGAVTSEYLVHRWLGISAFFIAPILFLIGFKLVFKRELLPIFPAFVFSLFSGLWLCLLFAGAGFAQTAPCF